MSKDLLQRISPFFLELLRENGFKIHKEIHDRIHFGNELIEFRSEKIIVKFIKDRNYIDISISPLHFLEQNFELQNILEFLDPNFLLPDDATETDRLSMLASAMKKEQKRIENLFVTDQISLNLEKLSEFGLNKLKQKYKIKKSARWRPSS